jgi:hypothetical protein
VSTATPIHLVLPPLAKRLGSMRNSGFDAPRTQHIYIDRCCLIVRPDLAASQLVSTILASCATVYTE